MEKIFGIRICGRRAKIRSEIVLCAIFSSLVHQFSFKLHRVIVQNNVQQLVEVKLRKKSQGPKFGANGPKLSPKIRFLGIFSSLAHQLSFKLHSIIAWNSVQHYQSYNSLKMQVGSNLDQTGQNWVQNQVFHHFLMVGFLVFL